MKTIQVGTNEHFGRVVFVISGKGGVGKSTIAANVAASLAARGCKVGMLDADLHGPSQAEMFGAFEAPRIKDGKIQPPIVHDVKLLSSGMLGGRAKAFVWRGPLLRGVLWQFLFDSEWGNLDYLVVDLPPGTGETLIALLSWLRPYAICSVLTPQEVAAADTRRALEMLRELGIKVDLIVENMATFECPHCHTKSPVFTGRGGKTLAEEYEVPVVVRLPLQAALSASGDAGVPTVIGRDPSDPIRMAFDLISDHLTKG